MCGICGCSDHPHDHHHHHEHAHDHHDIIHVEQDLLAKNNQFATANRALFTKANITPVNLMSSPGSGKTTLLSRTFTELKQQLDMAVIVGDQQTEQDADRLKSAGANALQINTGSVCHLDAHMVGHALESLALKTRTTLFIENIGNLVCPALFDLGETFRVVLLSVTEGDNKPLKYPDMFRKADVMLLTKMDLLPYVEFNPEKAIDYAQRINPAIRTIRLSATTGEGLGEWYQWLRTASGIRPDHD